MFYLCSLVWVLSLFDVEVASRLMFGFVAVNFGFVGFIFGFVGFIFGFADFVFIGCGYHVFRFFFEVIKQVNNMNRAERSYNQ